MIDMLRDLLIILQLFVAFSIFICHKVLKHGREFFEGIDRPCAKYDVISRPLATDFDQTLPKSVLQALFLVCKYIC